MKKKMISTLLLILTVSQLLTGCSKTNGADTYKSIDSFDNINNILTEYSFELEKETGDDLKYIQKNNKNGDTFEQVAIGHTSGYRTISMWYDIENEEEALEQFTNMVNTLKEELVSDKNANITKDEKDIFVADNGNYYCVITLYKDKVFVYQTNENDESVNEIIEKIK